MFYLIRVDTAVGPCYISSMGDGNYKLQRGKVMAAGWTLEEGERFNQEGLNGAGVLEPVEVTPSERIHMSREDGMAVERCWHNKPSDNNH